jgi:hypothetical protein
MTIALRIFAAAIMKIKENKELLPLLLLLRVCHSAKHLTRNEEVSLIKWFMFQILRSFPTSHTKTKQKP